MVPSVENQMAPGNTTQVMRDYFLRSARLGFGIWTAEDLPLALGLWDDAEVTRLTGGPFTQSRYASASRGKSSIRYRTESSIGPSF